MNIFLVGFMGVGKSTLGAALAQKLDLRFVDLDTEIVKDAGMAIPKIFELYGEDHFRKLEQATLRRFIGNEEVFVFSTGGGLPCFFDNMQLMNTHGVCIYLRATAAALTARLAPKISARPVLRGREDDLQDYISTLLTNRRAYYEKAQLIVDLDLTVDPQDNATKILEALDHYHSSKPTTRF